MQRFHDNIEGLQDDCERIQDVCEDFQAAQYKVDGVRG